MTATTVLANSRRDWRGAYRAMKLLLADPDDTVQVFKIMQALNAGTSAKNYRRLISTHEGGRIAYARVELVTRLTDSGWLSQFAPGTVGAAYRTFLEKTGFSANGLEAVSKEVHAERNDEHPYAWFGRRERDIHDIWHVLTGYRANDPLGELCLVAFSYAQTKGMGWGFIAFSGALKSLTEQNGGAVRRAIWEGYRHGRAAHWLHNEDIEALFAEPLDAARARLNIAKPELYKLAQQAIRGGAPATQPVATVA
jgi:ubiquinone biosynthesis protein COQ4